MGDRSRRDFIREIGAGTGTLVLAPALASCASRAAAPAPPVEAVPRDEPAALGEPAAAESAELPLTPPEGWDPIAWNRDRGNGGAIPESYREAINGPDGETGHLGKHLPFVPDVDESVVPEGYVAIMWGDAERGHARHPNSPRGTEGYEEGHWYDWIRVRKAVEGQADEVESTFTDWPESAEGDTGSYAVLGGGEMTDDGGRNAIYLARLPADVTSGDALRIHAHCRYHGEYVDFLRLP